MTDSRTSKSIKNANVAIFFYFAQMLMGFWSRKVFYDYLGSEVLGLDTTAGTILGFLNLAELGVSSAVGYFLYKPVFNKDFKTINEIVALQGWIYRRVAIIIIMAAAILMCFFPIIFKDISIPLWYAYATFSVLLFGALLGYFVNYKMCVLYADQREYKVTKITQSANLLMKIILVVLLPIVSHPFIFYISLNFFSVLFGTVWINHVLKKNYPWLGSVETSGRNLLRKYPELLKKTKQIFVHRISTVVVLEIQPMIMYAFTSLSIVAYYGNYIAIIGKAKDIIKTAFNSTQAGVGNLVAGGDKNRIIRVFWELFDSRMCLSTSAILVLGAIADPFISVWLSKDYLLGPVVLSLILIQSWISIMRTTVDNFVAGYGLFQDVWAPITESVLYLGGSLIFGYLWGISGVLMGGLLSNLVIICIWKPIFLFKCGFNMPYIKCYFIPVFKRLVLIGINACGFYYISYFIREKYTIDSFYQVTMYAMVLSLLIFPLLYGEFLAFSRGMRDFNNRMIQLVKSRIKK